MSVNTLSSNFSSDVSTYIAQKVLSVALKNLVLYQLTMKQVLPKSSSRTFQFTRYNRVALPQTKLTEGTTPGDSSMSISTVTAVMDQWGAVIPISDVAIDSVRHPVLQQALELAGLQAAETIDREIAIVLLGGSNVFFPNAISARGSLTTSDKIDSPAVGKVVSNLRYQGARPFDGSNYFGVVDPFSEEDLIASSVFVTAAQYSNIKALQNQEIGMWKGVRWMRSNTLPAISLLTGQSGTNSATAGSLSTSTTYNFKLSVVNPNSGHEDFMSAVTNAATTTGTSVDITVPALPSGAIASSTYNLYFGSNGGTLYLAQQGLAASSTANQGTVPTSGAVAQAAPPSSVRVHHAFILGKEGLQCVELNKIKTMLTPAVPSDSDPLMQRRKVGWKTDFKAVVSNDNFIARLEHYTSYGSAP